MFAKETGRRFISKCNSQASKALDDLLNQLGDSITLRGFIMGLSGIDILDSVRPQLIRICASGMDEGIAAWQTPERSRLGLYAAWRATAQYDADPFLHELPDWQEIIAELPVDAVDTIILQLTRLEIPQAKWEGYLRRFALELPGWSGLNQLASASSSLSRRRTMQNPISPIIWQSG